MHAASGLRGGMRFWSALVKPRILLVAVLIWNGMMKRYLSLWFPDWPLTRLRRAKTLRRTVSSDHKRVSSDTDRAVVPFVLVEAGAHGLRVAAANAAARNIGIGEGLAFTDAKARAPSLCHEDIDRAADTRALEALAEWMIRFAPLVAIDGLDGVMLETTGCDHLYGGEAGMLKEIAQILKRE